MPHERNLRIIEQIRSSLQDRRYDDFVDLFDANGVYELPFALSRSVSRYEGIAAIRARFIEVANSPVNRRYDLERVDVGVHQSLDPDVVVIELSVRGKLHETGAAVDLQSSIAVVYFEGDKIKRYRDYPNSAGIAEAVGLLEAYAASIAR